MSKTVQFDIRGWGLVNFTDHPLVHDQLLATWHDDLVNWFAEHGYAVKKEVGVDYSLAPTMTTAMNDFCIIQVPEHLALAFKLRFYTEESFNGHRSN